MFEVRKICRIGLNLSFVVLLPIAATFFGGSVFVASGEVEQSRGTVTGSLLSPEGLPLPEGTIVGLVRSGVLKEQMGDGSSNDDDIVDPTLLERGYVLPPDIIGELDLETGAFLFEQVSYKNYVLTVVPADSSNLILEQTPFVPVFQSTVDIGEVALVEPQISGRLFLPDGESAADGTVFLNQVDEPDEEAPYGAVADPYQGRFFFNNIPDGQYTILGEPSYFSQSLFPSDPVTITVDESIVPLTVSIPLNGPDLYGYVVSPRGGGLSDLYVNLEGGPDAISKRESTNYLGYWTMGLLEPGTYTVTTEFSSYFDETNLLEPAPFTVEIPTENLPLTITLDPWPREYKTIEGVFLDNYSEPVTDVVFSAYIDGGIQQTMTRTTEDGSFKIELFPGSWFVEAESDGQSGELANYFIIDSQRQITFENTPEIETVNWSYEAVRIDAGVSGQLLNEDGSAFEKNFDIYFSNLTYDVEFMYDSYDDSLELNGVFTQTLAPGEYRISVVPAYDPFVEVVVLEEINVEPGSLLDLGDIVMSRPSAVVQGVIQDSDGNPIPEITVAAYSDGSYDASFKAWSSISGTYSMTLPVDRWRIKLEYGPYIGNYFYIGDAYIEDLSAGEVRTDFDFELIPRDSVITGTFVDESGVELPDVYGGVTAHNTSDMEMPYPAPSTGFVDWERIVDGQFFLNLIPGRYLFSFSDLFDYRFVKDPGLVEIGKDESLTLDVELAEPNTSLTGSLIDARSGEPIDTQIDQSNIDFVVTAEQNHHSRSDFVDGSNQFELDLIPGEWKLGWRYYQNCYGSCEYLDFISPNSSLAVSLTEGVTESVNLPVYLKDGTISGQLDVVFDYYDYYDYEPRVQFSGVGELADLSTSQSPDTSGDYAKDLPHGTWLVQPFTKEPGLYAPAPLTVEVGVSQTVTNVNFNFLRPDAVLTGTVRAIGLNSSRSLRLEGSTDHIGFNETRVSLTPEGEDSVGSFVLPVRSGNVTLSTAIGVWDEDRLWTGSTTFVVTGDQTVELLLFPARVFPMGQSDYIDASEPFTFALQNGMQAFFPAGSLADAGLFKVEIGSDFSYPSDDLRLLNYGYGLSIVPRFGDESLSPPFLKPIEYSLPYPVNAPWGLNGPDEIEVVGYSPIDDQWESIPEFELNKSARTIRFSSNRHTKFALVAPSELFVDGVNSIYPFKAYMPIID